MPHSLNIIGLEAVDMRFNDDSDNPSSTAVSSTFLRNTSHFKGFQRLHRALAYETLNDITGKNLNI